MFRERRIGLNFPKRNASLSLYDLRHPHPYTLVRSWLDKQFLGIERCHCGEEFAKCERIGTAAQANRPPIFIKLGEFQFSKKIQIPSVSMISDTSSGAEFSVGPGRKE